jgi:peptide/nickel transport system substrate-binding protein
MIGSTRRQFLKRCVVAAAGTGVVPSLLAACTAAPAAQGGASGAAPASGGKTLSATIVLPGQFVESMNPYAHSVSGIYPTWKHVMEPLVDFDFDKKAVRGVLAESWTNPDPNTWLIKLRQGVKFHDGGDLTAADVVYSFIDRIQKDPDSKQADSFNNVDAVEALDPQTVRLHTKSPDAAMLFRLFQRFITSKAAHAPGLAEGDKLAIGSGPYKFKEWVPGQRFVLEKNTSYAGPYTPTVDQVLFRPITEQAASITALLNGEADLISNITDENVTRVTGSAYTVTGRDLTIMFLGMNEATVPEFKNKLVRQAISYAIDRNAIVNGVLKGRAYPLDAPIGSNQNGYVANLQPQYTYDPARAKALLAEAGYPNGFDVEFVSQMEQYPKVVDVSTALVSMLNDVGIRAKLTTREFTTVSSDLMTGKLPAFIMGRGTVIDPSEYLHQYFQTGITKRINFSSTAVDQALAAEQAALDPNQRQPLLQKAMEELLEEAPVVWLFQYQSIFGVSNRFDYTVPGTGEMYAWNLKPRAGA